ncbi:hypothetical protein EVAR_40412_1 [Eumeta japonica]|uniref:Uncharacterized protein n=1 Tax=Eumeta variegata TaxID=151549 RepID=A0A4C1W9C2_EUMVA|nr:hypothetical protein EVAR_40412_1 [Eumeta japonica]
MEKILGLKRGYERRKASYKYKKLIKKRLLPACLYVWQPKMDFNIEHYKQTRNWPAQDIKETYRTRSEGLLKIINYSGADCAGPALARERPYGFLGALVIIVNFGTYERTARSFSLLQRNQNGQHSFVAIRPYKSFRYFRVTDCRQQHDQSVVKVT